MKRFVQNWWLGFLLLLRLVIALLLLGFGAALVSLVPLSLMGFHIATPLWLVVVLNLGYLIIGCPLLLVSYARYTGWRARPVNAL